MKSKSFFLVLLLAVSGIFFFSSCGNDDDEIVVTTPTEEGDDGNFPPVFFNPDDMPEMGVVIRYNLFNQDGERTTVFKYGDDIIFDFSITNVTDSVIQVNDERDGNPPLFVTTLKYGAGDISRIQNGIFNVRTGRDDFVGYPYNPGAMMGVNQTADLKFTLLTPPNYKDSPNYRVEYGRFPNTIRWTASWSGKQYEGFMSSWRYKYYELGVDNEPLAPGDYYTEFVVNLTSRVRKTVRVDFTVTE